MVKVFWEICFMIVFIKVLKMVKLELEYMIWRYFLVEKREREGGNYKWEVVFEWVL